MPSEKERFEILLEDVRSQLQIVAEGHSLLNQKIDRVEMNLQRQIDDLRTDIGLGIKEVYKRIDRLESRMDRLETKINA